MVRLPANAENLAKDTEKKLNKSRSQNIYLLNQNLALLSERHKYPYSQHTYPWKAHNRLPHPAKNTVYHTSFYLGTRRGPLGLTISFVSLPYHSVQHPSLHQLTPHFPLFPPLTSPQTPFFPSPRPVPGPPIPQSTLPPHYPPLPSPPTTSCALISTP